VHGKQAEGALSVLMDGRIKRLLLNISLSLPPLYSSEH
jgi:hypothetical protein